MLKFFTAALAALLYATPLLAQSIQLAPGQVVGNSTASARPGRAENFTAVLDRAFGSTQNAIMLRGASSWITPKGPTYNVDAFGGSIQATVDATAVTNGGTVEIPCGTYALGAASVGLNLDGRKSLRVTSSGQPGGGAAQCVSLVYTGTGSAISAKNVSGIELDHLYVIGATSAKVIDMASGANIQAGAVYIHDSSLFGQVGVSIIVDAASATGFRAERNVYSNGAIGIRGILNGSGIAGGQFMVNAQITDNNSFQDSLTVAAISGLESATVSNNIFQGQILAYQSGPAATCVNVVWSGNWHGDAVASQNLIQSNCALFTSIGNHYNAGAGGTAIAQANSTGAVASIGDAFFGAGDTAVNIGTGNSLTMQGIVPTTAVPVIVGTPSLSGVPSEIVWGSIGINTSFTDAPFGIASYSNLVTSPAVKIYGSDRAVNAGHLSINKASGVAGEAQIASADTVGIAPIRIVTGDLRLGGVYAGNRPGLLRFDGVTSGTVLITPQSVAGAPTLTLPNASGTFAVSATAPLALSATTGALTCATCLSNNTITDDTTTNATMYPVWVTAASGDLPLKVTSTKLNFNPSTGFLGVGNTAANSLLHVGPGTDAPTQTSQLYVSNTGASVFTLRDSTNDIEAALGTNPSLGGVGLFGTRTSHPLYIQTNSTNIGAFHVSGGMSLGSTTDPGAFAISSTTTIKATTGFILTNRLNFNTAPVATTFCTTPSIPANNGTAAFTINVGTGCAASTGTITMPAATTGWVCDFHNVTVPASNIVEMTGGTTTTVTLTNYARTTGVAANWTDSHIIRAKCSAY